MQQEDVRKTLTAQFYRSLSQSGVEIKSISQPELQALVDAMADGVFAALDSLEEEANTPPSAQSANRSPTADPGEEEELLWSGRPYLTLGIRFELTTQRLRIIRGLLGRSYEEIELVRVRDTSVSQHVGERALNVGDVAIVSNDPRSPNLTLNNVKDPMEVREMIRQATLAEKERRGLHYREEM